MSSAIRRMQEADVAAVAALEMENFSMPWSAQAFTDVLCREDVIFLVACEEDRILGYVGVYCSLDEGEITNVCVAASARRKGIGEQLLTELFKHLQGQGIHRVILEVRTGNTPAIRLYEKLGFRVAGTRRDFYERPREDAYVMVREALECYPVVSTGG
jgi:ribosomal-protein-alanine N-acetyltransferase